MLYNIFVGNTVIVEVEFQAVPGQSAGLQRSMTFQRICGIRIEGKSVDSQRIFIIVLFDIAGKGFGLILNIGFAVGCLNPVIDGYKCMLRVFRVIEYNNILIRLISRNNKTLVSSIRHIAGDNYILFRNDSFAVVTNSLSLNQLFAGFRIDILDGIRNSGKLFILEDVHIFAVDAHLHVMAGGLGEIAFTVSSVEVIAALCVKGP